MAKDMLIQVICPKSTVKKEQTTEHTENFSVISRNYSKIQNPNLSPERCTEYK